MPNRPLSTKRTWIASWCAIAASLTLGLSASFADDLKPGDALDESKVGVAAKFIPIKAGEFDMGSPYDEIGRELLETPHVVKLTKDYEMQATAVTQLQYFLVMGRNPSKFTEIQNCDDNNFQVKFGLGLCVNHPVENVSWYDAQNFIKKLNQIQNEYTYRLPTEAEREYATRGGRPSSFPYSFGYNNTDDLDNHGWYSGNSNSRNYRTHAVALKLANPYGLYDMHGNVWEWVQDWFGEYPTSSVTDPTGPTEGSARVLRGGAWNRRARYLRSAKRYGLMPDFRSYDAGFRLVRTKK
jgi:formylglycine-generating enzyme required for sulfatase activity